MQTIMRQNGMTLIELLVVIAIIGLMIQLLLPATTMSRETARRAACQNNLKQIGVAFQVSHDVHRHLPSGGWNYEWAGEPERGVGRDQPGSWIFNILDQIEEQDLRALGSKVSDDLERAKAFRTRCETPLALFNCPSRRLPRAYPLRQIRHYYSREGLLPLEFEKGAKSDYAACVGSTSAPVEFLNLGDWQPPHSLAEAEAPGFLWPDDEGFEKRYGKKPRYDGLVYGRSEVRFSQVTDGLSKAYLVGEKYMPVAGYKTGEDRADNEHMYAGFNNDVNRTAYYEALRDQPYAENRASFGSAHPNTWNMLFADGSVHSISYDMFLEVHWRLGSRNDGKAVNWNDVER